MSNISEKAVVVLLLVLFAGSALLAAALGDGGGSRGPGLDIAVTGITSHYDGQYITLTPLNVSARIANTGTSSYSPKVNATLRINEYRNGTLGTQVFTNRTSIGASVNDPGDSLAVTFPAWTPGSEGDYIVNVSVDASDDHAGNNSLAIRLRAVKKITEGLKVTSNVQWKRIPIGETTQNYPNTPYVFTIENTGMGNDTFDIDISSAWVMPGWKNATANLSAGGKENMVVHVAVPSTASPYDFDILVYTATSRRNSTVSASAVVNTSIPKKGGVEITVVSADPQEAYPGGDWVDFTFWVFNSGDFADTYDLEAVSRPSNWQALLLTSSVVMLNAGEGVLSYARIRVPPLNFETMEQDSTFRGDTGALILQATSPFSKVTGSGEGTVFIGLVHTVQMIIDPLVYNLTFRKDVTQDVFFDIQLRSINNMRGSTGVNMEVNLTLPNGPNGVQFKPIWSPSYDTNESKRWYATVPAGLLNLTGGEWSKGQMLWVTAPMHPFQGTAYAKVVAVPLLPDGIDGIGMPKESTVQVRVAPFLEFELKPPSTEYFDDPELSLNDDRDDNGIEDWREGVPGETLVLPFNITNLGNGWDRYSVQAAIILLGTSVTFPSEWKLSYPSLVDELLPYWFEPESANHSYLIKVKVTVPWGTPIGESANISVRAMSMTSADLDSTDPLWRTASITVHVKQGFGLDLEPEESARSAAPRETVVFWLNATNTGNGLDRIRTRVLGGLLPDWIVELNETEFNLLPRQTTTIPVRVTPGETAVKDQVLSLRVRAESLISRDIFDEVWVNTTVLYTGGISLRLLEGDATIWRHPGGVASFLLEAANSGNGNDTIEISVDKGAEMWGATVGANGESAPSINIELPRSSSMTFWANITLPSLEQIRDYDDLMESQLLAGMNITNLVTATLKGAPSINASLELYVGVLQEHKAYISGTEPGRPYKEIMVGEGALFSMQLVNRGNGLDLLRVLPYSAAGDQRHISWTALDVGPYTLEPFSGVLVNVTITPDPGDAPAFHEVVDIALDALAGDNLTYWRTNVTAIIVMSKLMTKDMMLDLGAVEDVTVRICNMPDPGQTPIPDWPLENDYNVSVNILLQGDLGEGWEFLQKFALVTLLDAYQVMDVKLPLKAPDDLISNSALAPVQAEVAGDSGKVERLVGQARAVYFDASIDPSSTSFENLYEGGKAKAYIRIIASGTRAEDSIPVRISVGDESYTVMAGPADPTQYVDMTQEVVVVVEFDLPTLKWYEKAREVGLRVTIDPSDGIRENTREGRAIAESNNEMRDSFIMKNYTPSFPVLLFSGVLLVLVWAAGIVGYFYLEDRDSWFLVPLSSGLSGFFGLLFFLPLEETRLGVSFANNIGLGIILLDIFLIFPIMIYLFTKSGDAHVLYILIKERNRPPAEGMEICKPAWKPYLISFLGALLMTLVPLSFWVVSSEMDEGVLPAIGSLVSAEGVVMPLLILLLVPLISLVFQTALIALKKGALKGINRTWNQLDRLKIELEEGFK